MKLETGLNSRRFWLFYGLSLQIYSFFILDFIFKMKEEKKL